MRETPHPIISVSGIRGILGSSLTPENILKFSSAFAGFTHGGKIVVGRDGRLFGDLIADVVVSVLSLSGCEVIDLDIVPTPTVCMAVRRFKAEGGISITASHNPQEWNGMKFIGRDGIVIDARNIMASPHLEREVGGVNIKQIEYYPDFSKYHISRVLNSRFVNIPLIRRRKFRVAVDCVNSSGSFIIPELLKQLGCTVITHDCNASGIFTRNPEPIPENLKRTSALIKKSKGDLGIVVDPDADRLVILTEKGEPFGEENTITTVINYLFKHLPRSKRIAVVNLSTTRAVDDVVKKHNGKLYKSPVGELNVIKEMKRRNAVIGGEGSGGVIFPAINFCRDSLAGIGLILSELAESKLSVSEYKKQLPSYYIVKDKIKYSGGQGILKRFQKRILKSLSFGEGFRVRFNTQDGLRIDFPDSWINFRKSNTEPIMRIIAEARTAQLASALIDELKEIMSS